jgi:hypothetical protein
MSNQQEGEKEDVDSDGKVGFFDSCDCAAALPDDSNKSINCTYMVLPV